jgi:hypothetical protein
MLAIFLLSAGIVFLPFITGSWKFEEYWPIVPIAFGLDIWIGIEIFRKMSQKPIPPKIVEELRKYEEQMVDNVVKRAGRYALILAVLGYVGFKFYVDGIYGAELNKFKSAADTVAQFYKRYDTLKTLEDTLERGLHASKAKLSKLEESESELDALVSEFRWKLHKMDSLTYLENQEFQRFPEYLDNAKYTVRINCSATSLPDALRIQSALKNLHFNVPYPTKHSQTLVNLNRDKARYYQPIDSTKVIYVISKLKDSKFSFKPTLDTIEKPSDARTIDLWK